MAKTKLEFKFLTHSRLDHSTAVNVTCVGAQNNTVTRLVYPPGDYKSDAEVLRVAREFTCVHGGY